MQLAMSLGESADKRVLPLLEKMALEKGNIQYMSLAILSSVSKQSAQMLDDFFAKEKKGEDLGEVKSFFLPLCTTVAAQRDPQEISKMLVAIKGMKSDENKLNCLKGIASEFTKVAKMKLTDEATRITRDSRISRFLHKYFLTRLQIFFKKVVFAALVASVAVYGFMYTA